MKYIFALAFCLISSVLFAQQKQFMLIVRSKYNLQASPDEIKTNIAHWTAYMTDLGKSGKIAGGYRPGMAGVTISGKGKSIKDTPYLSDGDVVSSVLVISAADMEEAKAIAAKCPVYELDGSVEIRTVQNTAN